MKKSAPSKKLVVNRETLRALAAIELVRAVGGVDSGDAHCVQAVVPVPSQVPGVDTCAPPG